MKPRAILVHAKECADRSGNTYFSVKIKIQYKNKLKIHRLPFQYGYDDQYRFEADLFLEKSKVKIRETPIFYVKHRDTEKKVREWGIVKEGEK